MSFVDALQLLNHPSWRHLCAFHHILAMVWEMKYGGVSYLGCVIGIWVDFDEITMGKWSLHQLLGFSKVWLGKKFWFLSSEVWLCVGNVLGTPQLLSKDSPLFW